MTNPLLTPFSLPPFSAIHPEDIVPAVKSALDECRQAVERVVAQPGPFTWDNLCQPLAESDDRLSRIWSPVGRPLAPPLDGIHPMQISPQARYLQGE